VVHCSQWALVDPTRRPAEESLPHIAKLIAAGSHLAIKQLPRTSDPKKDFRWILVGWDLQCGPQHASTHAATSPFRPHPFLCPFAGWPLCTHKASYEAAQVPRPAVRLDAIQGEGRQTGPCLGFNLRLL